MSRADHAADELAHDLATVLNPAVELSDKSRRRFVDVILWQYVEIGKKYLGCRYRSREAHRIITESAHGWRQGLRLDHAVPRDILTAALLASPGMDAVRAREVLEQLAVGVVLTQDEDRRVGKEHRQTLMCGSTTLEDMANKADRFARYRHAGVEIVERDSGDAIPDSLR